MELVFATNNLNKLTELQNIITDSIVLKCLSDINCKEEIPETGDTLEDNASQKSTYIYSKYKINCFSDDTGLEIEALNGAPGVYSARYAGEDKDAKKNMTRVLQELNGIKNRKARFRTVISLIIDGKEHQFEGVVNGQITEIESGKEGFGYDPIFIPDGYTKTFAELSLDEKNKISHRGNAVKKLVKYLNTNYTENK
ncbi:non-canonical purine NTP diphosphatase [Plebeiibacterium sediminum]|uniref:dITP/XTP pyrophosphatase n=1 Tax=Plebeiibacterium sediminum TaxID=2992112 RepID=A0AAE3SDQ5_9BACT|nr:non-canonical purine NTP diphosphatase [Plebeiobacterium sediminum]MCW3785117.1 non-canonical purine NTP diphosphatase [Plebeiobacterium sediminum]